MHQTMTRIEHDEQDHEYNNTTKLYKKIEELRLLGGKTNKTH